MSNNYGTSYNISQTGDLYTLQDHGAKTGLAQYTSTRGTTVNAPMNQRNFKVFKNFDNEFYFFVKTQDRKPLALHGLQISGSLVHRETRSIIFTTKCITIDPDMGSCKLLVRASDTTSLDDGYYDLVLSYNTGQGLTLPLYTDQNMRPNFTLEVSRDATAVPIGTQTADTFYNTSNDGYIYSQRLAGPTYFNKRAGLVTFAVYASEYTGKFYLQGTTASQPEEGDWFDLDIGMANYFYQFVNFTGIEPFNFNSNLRYVRTKHEDNGTGTIDKIVVRV
jgi:hypothetical protein